VVHAHSSRQKQTDNSTAKRKMKGKFGVRVSSVRQMQQTAALSPWQKLNDRVGATVDARRTILSMKVQIVAAAQQYIPQ
jgi:hypothetical protein